MSNLFRPSSSSEENEWLSVSDMMAGLMVIFLFIAILPRSQIDTPEEAAIQCWWKKENEIYQALFREFEHDLPAWEAEIQRNPILIRFKSAEVLFESGSAEIKPKFKDRLEDFFPRYARELRPFKEDIEELRIEGHTSSEWQKAKTEQESYFHNMKLSQERTRSVLQYVLTDPTLYFDKKWVQPLLTANGLSFSKRIMKNNTEDKKTSRRVEFRVSTKARGVLTGIVEGTNIAC